MLAGVLFVSLVVIVAVSGYVWLHSQAHLDRIRQGAEERGLVLSWSEAAIPMASADQLVAWRELEAMFESGANGLRPEELNHEVGDDPAEIMAAALLQLGSHAGGETAAAFKLSDYTSLVQTLSPVPQVDEAIDPLRQRAWQAIDPQVMDAFLDVLARIGNQPGALTSEMHEDTMMWWVSPARQAGRVLADRIRFAPDAAAAQAEAIRALDFSASMYPMSLLDDLVKTGIEYEVFLAITYRLDDLRGPSSAPLQARLHAVAKNLPQQFDAAIRREFTFAVTVVDRLERGLAQETIFGYDESLGRLVTRVGREPLAEVTFGLMDALKGVTDLQSRHQIVKAEMDRNVQNLSGQSPWQRHHFRLVGLLMPAWDMAHSMHMRSVVTAEVLAAELAGQSWPAPGSLLASLAVARIEHDGAVGIWFDEDGTGPAATPPAGKPVPRKTMWIHGPVPSDD